MLVHHWRSRQMQLGNLDFISVQLGCEHATRCNIRLRFSTEFTRGDIGRGDGVCVYWRRALVCLLSTNWYQVASTIQLQNAADALRASDILNDGATS